MLIQQSDPNQLRIVTIYMYGRVCAYLNTVDLRKNKFRLLTSLVNHDKGTPTITKSLVQKAQEADPEKWGSIVNISNCLGNS